jgi:hypothetical protein
MTDARIILAVAAEADDEFVWSRLETLQAQMFAVGPVDIKLAYYGAEGPGQHVRPYVATHWVSDPAAMTDLIERAREQCICGCFVPIADILDHAAKEASVQAVVIIGDRFHGDAKAIAAKAKQLADAGTRLFVLQQGTSPGSERDFRRLAEASGGAFLQFNPHVERIAQRLPRLVEAITHFALGGLPALQAQDSEAAALLIEQMTTTKLPTRKG